MTDVLIVKLNATGDVVRTTALLRRLDGNITWLTASGNRPLLEGIQSNLRCVPWEQRDIVLDCRFDLVINLEDDLDVAQFVDRLSPNRVFGACLAPDRSISYSNDAREWFDMSLISRFGRRHANDLKLHNRRTYQQIVFSGLGYDFHGDRYLLPKATQTDLFGDVAIASTAGPVWPMKYWPHYDELRARLIAMGLRVNMLPHRDALLAHLGDIANHRCLVSGDSLPMHLALGLGVPCVTIFNCTSPWEIHDYGLQTQLVSPLLSEYFYGRGFDERAISAITLDEVFTAVLRCLTRTDRCAPN
jgi:ADP-heptose:LPS heptosyltransferase